MPDPYCRNVEDEGRALVERFGGRWTDRGGLCRCPAHDDRRPSLSVRVGRTSLLLHCFAGCDAAAILRAVRAAGHPVDAPSRRGTRPHGSSRRRDQGRGLALALWRNSRPMGRTAAELYLAGRGIRLPSPELRFHPLAPHGPRPLTCFRPALVAAVRDQSGLVAVHRTFLAAGGKELAPIDQPRRGLGRFGSGAVRLGGVASRLGLAEGVETALSASILFGLPCWATLGTERFRVVELPSQVSHLALFLDNDAGGRRAEALAREAFAHIERIEVHYPRRAGEDWNDVLRSSPEGAEAWRRESGGSGERQLRNGRGGSHPEMKDDQDHPAQQARRFAPKRAAIEGLPG